MTATTTDERVEQNEDEIVELDNPIPCMDLSLDGDCNNAAVYMCRPRCCLTEIPLCEDCFFTFVEWADACRKYNPRYGLVCNYCQTSSRLDSNYLIVLWRIR